MDPRQNGAMGGVGSGNPDFASNQVANQSLNGGIRQPSVQASAPKIPQAALQSNQTMSTGTTDIILNNDKPKKNSKILLILFGLVLLVGVGILVFSIIWQQGTGSSDTLVSATDEKLAELMDSNYDNVVNAQSLFVEARNGDIAANAFFTAEAKEVISNNVAALNDFCSQLESIEVDDITFDSVREDLATLKSSLQNDIGVYMDTLALYDLFYEYVNGGYSDASAILALNNADVTSALEKLDAVVDETGDYKYGTIVQDIFSVYDENISETSYYEYMGNIIARVRDAGVQNED